MLKVLTLLIFMSNAFSQSPNPTGGGKGIRPAAVSDIEGGLYEIDISKINFVSQINKNRNNCKTGFESEIGTYWSLEEIAQKFSLIQLKYNLSSGDYVDCPYQKFELSSQIHCLLQGAESDLRIMSLPENAKHMKKSESAVADWVQRLWKSYKKDKAN